MAPRTLHVLHALTLVVAALTSRTLRVPQLISSDSRPHKTHTPWPTAVAHSVVRTFDKIYTEMPYTDVWGGVLRHLAIILDSRVQRIHTVRGNFLPEVFVRDSSIGGNQTSCSRSPDGQKQTITCTFGSLRFTRGAHVLVVYAHYDAITMNSSRLAKTVSSPLLHLWSTDTEASASNRIPNTHTIEPRIATYYSPYLTVAALVMREIMAKGNGSTGVTIENILQNHSLRVADVYARHHTIISNFLSPLNRSMEGRIELTQHGNYFQHTPALGFYCMYRRHPGEQYLLPDCPNITETAQAHVAMLGRAGVDVLLFDNTNDGTEIGKNKNALATNKRPVETVFEEFAELRAKGWSTPQVPRQHSSL